MEERICRLRKSLRLTQKEFGEKLGLAANTITNYENGIRTPREQTLIAICREYSVNYSWLKEGIGDMFVYGDDHSLDALVADHRASKEDIDFVRKYLELSTDARKIVRSILKEVLS